MKSPDTNIIQTKNIVINIKCNSLSIKVFIKYIYIDKFILFYEIHIKHCFSIQFGMLNILK